MDLRSGVEKRRSGKEVQRSTFARFLELFDFRLLQQNLAHFRRAHTANKCLLLINKQTTTAGNHRRRSRLWTPRIDELVGKHIDAPPLTRSQFGTNNASLSYIPRHLSIDAISEASRNLLGVRHCGNPGGLGHRSERPGHPDLTHSWQ
jgi:hypothetical protein